MLFDENGRPKRRISIWIPLGVLAISLVLASIIIINRPKPLPAEPVTEIAPEVQAVRVINIQAKPVVTTTGRVSSPHQINIVSRVSGIIESVAENFRDGASFAKGDLLLKIEDQDYRIALSQSEASLASALQLLATEQGQADQAKRQWQDLGNAEANALFLREPQLNAAKAQVTAARANLEQAELNLQRTEIRAPFTGVISEIYADVGQFVTTGSSLAEVQSTERVQIKASLTANEISDLGWQNLNGLSLEGTTAQISYQVGRTLITREALVQYLSPLIDPMTQMSEITLDLIKDEENIEPTPFPGQFVDIRLEGAPVEQVVWIPQTALFERNQLLLANDNTLRIREVDILASTEGRILVKGLSDGDLVVTDRPLWIFPGQRVTPVLAGD